MNGQTIYNVFSQTDPAEHARMQRPIAKYLSIGAVLALEPLMDKSINDLCDNLERRFADDSKTCDLGEWIAYCLRPHFLAIYRRPLSLSLYIYVCVCGFNR